MIPAARIIILAAALTLGVFVCAWLAGGGEARGAIPTNSGAFVRGLSSKMEAHDHAATWENPRGAEYALSQQAIDDSRERPAPSDSGPTGFDTERGSEAIVQAVSVRFEQLANPNCKRQRSFRPSPRGLTGVDSQGARVAHRRKHTSSAASRLRVAAQIQKMVEAPTPLVPKAADCLKFSYARERASGANFVDPGSIPGGSTHRKQSVHCAQQQESAARPASEDDSASGSAKAQPGLIGGVA